MRLVSILAQAAVALALSGLAAYGMGATYLVVGLVAFAATAFLMLDAFRRTHVDQVLGAEDPRGLVLDVAGTLGISLLLGLFWPVVVISLARGAASRGAAADEPRSSNRSS